MRTRALRVSLVIPVYNEMRTLPELLRRVVAVDFAKELVLVDDGSSDGSRELLEELARKGLAALPGAAPANENTFRVLLQEKNQGKGAALRRGIQEATGDLLTILDADLEYDPADFPDLLAAVRDEGARVVYGKRSYGGHAAYSFWYVLGNKALAFWASFLYDAWLSDIETCLKVAPTELWRTVELRSSGFGIEAEVTGKFLRAGERIFEVPISYRARGREEGKKIQWTDGVAALWILLKLRLAPGPKALPR